MGRTLSFRPQTYDPIAQGSCRSVTRVIQAGFEPTTHSLEGCCSIQLSYWTAVIAGAKVAKSAETTLQTAAPPTRKVN